MSVGFLSLPYELQQEIISHIIRVTDLQSLCLVSKDFSAKFTPELFKHVVLLWKEEDPEWLPRSLMSLSSSRGLPFVKKLRIGHTGVRFGVRHGLPHELEQLLHKLQDDSLHDFEYGACNWPILGQYEQNFCCCPSLKEIEQILRHQRKLRILRFDRSAYWEHLLFNNASVLKSLDSLIELQIKLFWNVSETSANELMSALDLARLRVLAIDARAITEATAIPLLKSFLSERLSMRLTRLTLSYVNFGQTHLLQLASFPSLTHLALLQCSVDSGFTGESASWSSHKLKSLFFYCCNSCIRKDDMSRSPEAAYLVQLLHEFEGLDTLVVRMNCWMTGETQENLGAAIDMHKSTLKCLILDDIDQLFSEQQSTYFFRHALFNLAKEYQNLVQLRMSYGPPNAVLAKCKVILENVPSLEILHVNLGLTFEDGKYSRTVENTANQLMRKIPTHSKFSLLSFGDDDKFSPYTCRHWQTGHPYPRRCFVRGGKCDECLREKVLCDKDLRAPLCSRCKQSDKKCIYSRTMTKPARDNRFKLANIPLFGPTFFLQSDAGRLGSRNRAVGIEPDLAKYLVPNLLEIPSILNSDGPRG